MSLLRRKLDINPRFRHALQLMEKTNRSLFITGRAGTGKSTLLAHFCARTQKKPVVLAPTGVAALNVKGQTIHKFFNFYIDITPEKIRSGKIKGEPLQNDEGAGSPAPPSFRARKRPACPHP